MGEKDFTRENMKERRERRWVGERNGGMRGEAEGRGREENG